MRLLIGIILLSWFSLAEAQQISVKTFRKLDWLQAKLGLDARQTHIGQFSEYMCEQVISLCQQAPVYTCLLYTSDVYKRQACYPST